MTAERPTSGLTLDLGPLKWGGLLFLVLLAYAVRLPGLTAQSLWRDEVDALLRGGVHRLHMENLKVGDHELVAVFTGKGPHWRDYRRGATLKLDAVIRFSDALVFLICVPNILGLYVLAPVVRLISA